MYVVWIMSLWVGKKNAIIFAILWLFGKEVVRVDTKTYNRLDSSSGVGSRGALGLQCQGISTCVMRSGHRLQCCGSGVDSVKDAATCDTRLD